ncbi:MAG TPA: hypothetical protein VJ783_07490 [Pirellulales bacterium]|nr:hypothetical protein [Pirellulales bacterium]
MSIEHQAEVKTLAERFGSGDEDCLDEIVRGVCPAICRVLAARPQFRDVAPDELAHVVSNSLLDAWLVHGKFNPARGTLFGWLLAYGNHSAANFARLPEIRSRRLRVAIDPDSLGKSEGASPSGDGDSDCLSTCRTRLIEMMRIALASLPERLRFVIESDMNSPGGLAPTAALAAELGLTPATIRDYRRRARPRLKAKLVELGVEKLLGAPRARPLSIREIELGQNGKRKTENHRSLWMIAVTRRAQETVGWRVAHRCRARVASPGRYLTGKLCIP